MYDMYIPITFDTRKIRHTDVYSLLIINLIPFLHLTCWDIYQVSTDQWDHTVAINRIFGGHLKMFVMTISIWYITQCIYIHNQCVLMYNRLKSSNIMTAIKTCTCGDRTLSLSTCTQIDQNQDIWCWRKHSHFQLYFS